MRRRLVRERGFSIPELIIASGLLLVVMLGVLPLFMRSVVSNESGSSSNRVKTLARVALEDLNQLPFDSARLTPVDGNELETIDQYDTAQKAWVPEDPTQEALWKRTTTVRQYSVTALDDGEIEESEALSATADPEFIHFKEIQVQVESLASGAAFGPARSVTLRSFKSQ